MDAKQYEFKRHFFLNQETGLEEAVLAHTLPVLFLSSSCHAVYRGRL